MSEAKNKIRFPAYPKKWPCIARVFQTDSCIEVRVGYHTVFLLSKDSAFFYPEELPERIRVPMTRLGKEVIKRGKR